MKVKRTDEELRRERIIASLLKRETELLLKRKDLLREQPAADVQAVEAEWVQVCNDLVEIGYISRGPGTGGVTR